MYTSAFCSVSEAPNLNAQSEYKPWTPTHHIYTTGIKISKSHFISPHIPPPAHDNKHILETSPYSLSNILRVVSGLIALLYMRAGRLGPGHDLWYYY